MTLNGFDLAFLMLAFLSIAMGLWRGFVFEALSVLGWILGFLAAMRLGPLAGEWLPAGSLSPEVRRVLGMLAMFIVAIFASSLLASLGRSSVQALGLRAADRLVGGLFGGLRIVLAGVVLAVIVHALDWQQEPWWRDSAAGPLLDTARQELARQLPSWKILQDTAPVASPPLGAVLQSLESAETWSPR